MKITRILTLLILIIFLQAPSFSENLSELAIAFYNDNSIEESLECLNKIPDSEKSSQDYLLLGNIYDEFGDRIKAYKLYNKAIKCDDKSFKAYYNIANLYFDNREYHKAIYYYKLALKNTKENAYINYNLGCSYLKIGDLKNANSEFLKAINIQNDIPEIYYNLAYTYKRLGNEKLSKKNLEIYNKLTEN